MTRRSLPSDPVERALLNEILAVPDDDAARLAYADRLLERGDPHGELIVVQCRCRQMEREGEVRTAAYHAARARERELVPMMEKRWAKAFGLGSEQRLGTIERGFLARTTHFDLERWGLWRAHPLVELVISQGGQNFWHSAGYLARLVAKPTIARARSLWFANARRRLEVEPSAAAAAFGDVPHSSEDSLWPEIDAPFHPRLLPIVRSVRFEHGTPKSLAWLAGAPAPALVAAELRNGDNRSDLAAVFAATRPTLEEVVVRARGVVVTGAESVLEASPTLPQLRKLHLDVTLDVAVARAVASRAPRLEDVHFGQVMTEDGLRALLAGSFVPCLRALSLSGRGATERTSLRVLTEAPFAALTCLTLDGFHFSKEDAAALASASGLARIHELRLVGGAFAADALAILRERWPSLDVFD